MKLDSLLSNYDEARLGLITEPRLVLDRVLFAATMMANSLHSLFQAIAQAGNECELRQHVMFEVGEYFSAQRWGIFFPNKLLPAGTKIQSIMVAQLSSKRLSSRRDKEA